MANETTISASKELHNQLTELIKQSYDDPRTAPINTAFLRAAGLEDHLAFDMPKNDGSLGVTSEGNIVKITFNLPPGDQAPYRTAIREFENALLSASGGSALKKEDPSPYEQFTPDSDFNSYTLHIPVYDFQAYLNENEPSIANALADIKREQHARTAAEHRSTGNLGESRIEGDRVFDYEFYEQPAPIPDPAFSDAGNLAPQTGGGVDDEVKAGGVFDDQVRAGGGVDDEVKAGGVFDDQVRAGGGVDCEFYEQPAPIPDPAFSDAGNLAPQTGGGVFNTVDSTLSPEQQQYHAYRNLTGGTQQELRNICAALNKNGVYQSESTQEPYNDSLNNQSIQFRVESNGYSL